ncbi:MAG: AbgT family transporter [Prevotella sp.]|nr:AbgT family transporter [Prevotella sp.]
MSDRKKRVTLTRRLSRLFAVLVVAMAVLQVAVVVGAWGVTSLWPDIHMRSVLSSDGVRWMFGHMSDGMTHVTLVWLMLWAMAVGTMERSLLWRVPFDMRALVYRQRVALRLVAVEAAVFVAVLLLLTAVPHALLLSVTGSLFPSSFSQGIVPYAALSVCVCAITYGVASEVLRSIDDVVGALVAGLRLFAPLFLLYVLAGQLCVTIRYVLM